MKAYDGHVLTHDNEEVFLGISDGYNACYRGKENAHKFDRILSDVEIAKWDGMPWYYRLKPGTKKIYKIEEEHFSTRTETVIEV